MVFSKTKNGKCGIVPQPERKRGRRGLSYIRALRRARLLLRELRRLERLERPEGARRWEPMTPQIGTPGAGGARAGTTALLETGIRKVRVETDGRIRASGRGFLLVAIQNPFVTIPVKWRGLKRTAQACRAAVTVLEVMSS